MTRCAFCGEVWDAEHEANNDVCPRARINARRPSTTVGEALMPKDERPVGLIEKYHVQRANDPLGKHSDCRFFVLDPRHDPLAIDALLAYAQAASRAGYHALAHDLREWAKREDAPSKKGSSSLAPGGDAQ